jgi:hypothetical protein
MKGSRIQISSNKLENHLKEQISFLETSANSFDAGAEEEAKRLALTIRILVHDTKSSQSLLGQMGRKLEFYDTSSDLDPQNILAHSGLISTLTGPHQTRYAAMLDNIPSSTVKMIDFDSWWNKPVFVDKQGRELTRKDLILTSANQDGGAHVDSSLDETYENLSRNGLGLIVNHGAGEKLLDKPERVAIRQIAHEVLKTLKPDYNKKLKYQTGMVSVDLKIKDGADEINDKGILTKHERKIGRNEPCPCGSGLKYKKCCMSVIKEPKVSTA